jgi:hypothetical protein
MSENPIMGTVPIILHGKEYTLRFTWEAVAQVIRVYGQDRDLFDPSVLCGVAVIGLQAHHPGMTGDDVRDGAPISKVMAAVTRALHVAYFGEQEVPAQAAEAKENPPAATVEPAPRKPSRKAPSPPLPEPTASPSEPESALETSGA